MSENETSRKSDFTIEHILNRAGEKRSGVGKVEAFGGGDDVVTLPWLQCTRYCPPKIPSELKTLTSNKKNSLKTFFFV